jgi:hypothetical protein
MVRRAVVPLAALLSTPIVLAACDSSDVTSRGAAPSAEVRDAMNDDDRKPPSPDAAIADSDADASVSDGPERGDGAQTLFDGVLTSDWRMSTITNQPGRDNPGRFTVEDGALVAEPGTDLGLLWYTRPTPPDYVLELEWKLSAPDDNSGVFVRFPDLDAKGYDNTAWVAINFGFEVQINEPGVPDGAPEHTTGAIYGQTDQSFTRVVANPPGMWNAFSIRVVGSVYTVTLNGHQVTRFENHVANRGLASTEGAPSFLGLQTHTGHVAYRNIRLRPP